MSRGVTGRRGLASTPVLVQDLALAAASAAVDLLAEWDPGATYRRIGHGPMHWQLLLLYALPGYAVLVWRRRHPTVVFAVVCAHSVAAQLLLPVYRPTLSVLLGLYSVARHRGPGRSLWALLGTAATSALGVADELRVIQPEHRTSALVAAVLIYALLDVSVWVAGWWVRRSRHEITDLAYRQEAAARSAVADERGRIARELHDIVAHSVTVIVVQAAGARRVPEPKPPQVDRALADIEATGRQAMAELRRLLGLLAAEGDSELEPLAGLADLPVALARIGATGLTVDLRPRGTPQRLDTSVDLAAYRVVTEGLTNALKHAGPGTRAVVELDWRPAQLTVSVTDDGPGTGRHGESRALSSGRGLIGLRERVRAVGGALDAGPRA
ncbi:MAG TPA: histidine kinase, partial [Rugosimonospora sp.]|nr:histidine kinase [Rugosimonospora sp.]